MRDRTASYRQACLLLITAIPLVSHAETADETHTSVAQLCAAAENPETCLVSYGYQCHGGRDFYRSLDAQLLSCNLLLPNTQAHFVQMSYVDGGWSI